MNLSQSALDSHRIINRLNVIYDSQRIKNLTDAQIERELRRIAPMLKALRNLLFVDRKRRIIVIKQTQRFDI